VKLVECLLELLESQIDLGVVFEIVDFYDAFGESFEQRQSIIYSLYDLIVSKDYGVGYY
jgi:uncharacterized protein YutD